MKGYNIINEDGQLCGWSSEKRDEDYIDIPVKLLYGEDKAIFNKETQQWEYEYADSGLGIIIEENPFTLVGNQVLSSIYIGNICPDNGDTILDKSTDISVLIPCYGKSDYIVDAVKSCINQTMKPVSVVVLLMDDLSIAMKDELEALDEIVTCYISERLNAVASRNKLVNEYCTTDWFVFLDGDDMLKSDCIEKMYNEDACVVYPAMQFMNDDDSIDEDVITEVIPFMNGNHTNAMTKNMTCLMHKDVFNEVGLDEELCNGGEDFDFNTRLLALKKYDISCIYDTCSYYRQVQEGLTKKAAFYESHLKSVVKNLEFLHSEFVEYTGYDELEDRFYNNPTLLTIYEAIKDESRDLDNKRKIVIEKDNNIRLKLDKSKRLEPLDEYSEDKFTLLYGNESDVEYLREDLNGKKFDVIFLQPLTKETIFEETFPMVLINNTIVNEIKDLRSYNLLNYLLENYHCIQYPLFESGYTDDTEVLFDNIKNASQVNDVTKEQIELIDAKKVPITKESTKVYWLQFIFHKTCNKACEYCALRTTECALTDKEIHKNFETMLKYFAKNLDGKIEIQILGGEPTLWSDDLTKDILNTINKYKRFILFTNGANKNSMFYGKKAIKNNVTYITHITDWKEHPEKLYRENLLKNETATIVITHNDIEDFKTLVLSDDKIKHTLVSPCTDSPNPKLDLSDEEWTDLSQFLVDNGFDYISKCENNNSMTFDCNTLTGTYCCKSHDYVSYDEVLTQEKTGCSSCIFRDNCIYKTTTTDQE